MISLLVHLLITAAVIYFASKSMPRVHVNSFGKAFLVAIAIGLLNFLVGWLLSLILNIATLGIFYFTGLTFIISIVVNAIIIEIVDQFSKGFNTDGFTPSLALAVIIALVNAIVAWIFRV